MNMILCLFSPIGYHWRPMHQGWV